jgi:NADPH-dependent glutamate synthase beta subunit-like oxidoreductase/ferredoxin
MTVMTRGGYARPGTATVFKTGTWRVQRPVHQHTAAPCHANCPAGEDAQAYIALVQGGRLQEAWETIVAVNPLPAITGRVCFHPCETGCNRGEYDEPIAIHGVERFLGDEALRHGWAYPVQAPPSDAPRVAVVGAGPAGLSAAYHLVRRGLNVVLFSALSEAGGTLHRIPEYRLPKSVLEGETARVLALKGIDYRPLCRLGRDVYLDDLRREFSAVFLGIGTQRGRDWNVGGVVPKDLNDGLDVLKKWMDVGSVPEGRSVAVVGGGNTAVDLARIMKRAGIPEVHIVTHNGMPGPDTPREDAMRAIPREIGQAMEEGVKIHFHRGIRRLILRGERVIGVEMVHMKKLRDGSGRLVRTAFEGTETVLHVDQVIPAIGQRVEPRGLESILDGRDGFDVDRWGRLGAQEGVYVGGDAGVSGTHTEAVGDGRLAAETIDLYLRGQQPAEFVAPRELTFNELNLHYFEPASRARQPILPVEERVGTEEVEGGLTALQVAAEARRCFSCGNCLACDNCWTLCPDSAVLKTRELAADGSHYAFDYDYCKGCGLCATECPCGYIKMVPEL